MKSVFNLQHDKPKGNGYVCAKAIGIYSSKEKGMEAIERSVKLEGFCDYPDDFHLVEYELDMDHWTEGFEIEEESR